MTEEQDPIVRTVFKIEVFSRGELNLAHRDDDPFGLLAINYEITEGECVGNVEEMESDPVDSDALEDELIRVGNDGHFFDEPE